MRQRDEAGETLTEVLVSVVIMGIVFTAVIAGLATSVLGSTSTRQSATVTGTLKSGSAIVGALPYVGCADAAAYDPGPAPDGYAIQVTEIRYFDGVGEFTADCDAPDNGLQQITLRVSSPQPGPDPRTLVFVKRQTP